MTCRKREDSFEFKGCGIAFDFSVPTEGCADGGAKESLNWGGRNPQGRREGREIGSVSQALVYTSIYEQSWRGREGLGGERVKSLA
jgi:hypothetical protein